MTLSIIVAILVQGLVFVTIQSVEMDMSVAANCGTLGEIFFPGIFFWCPSVKLQSNPMSSNVASRACRIRLRNRDTLSRISKDQVRTPQKGKFLRLLGRRIVLGFDAMGSNPSPAFHS